MIQKIKNYRKFSEISNFRSKPRFLGYFRFSLKIAHIIISWPICPIYIWGYMYWTTSSYILDIYLGLYLYALECFVNICIGYMYWSVFICIVSQCLESWSGDVVVNYSKKLCSSSQQQITTRDCSSNSSSSSSSNNKKL